MLFTAVAVDGLNLSDRKIERGGFATFIL